MIRRINKNKKNLILFSRKNITLKDYVEILKQYYSDLGIEQKQCIVIGNKKLNFNPLYSKYLMLVYKYKIGEIDTDSFTSLFLNIFKKENEVLFSKAKFIVSNMNSFKDIQYEDSIER